jgi:hypothetical protein
MKLNYVNNYVKELYNYNRKREKEGEGIQQINRNIYLGRGTEGVVGLFSFFIFLVVLGIKLRSTQMPGEH